VVVVVDSTGTVLVVLVVSAEGSTVVDVVPLASGAVVDVVELVELVGTVELVDDDGSVVMVVVVVVVDVESGTVVVDSCAATTAGATRTASARPRRGRSLFVIVRHPMERGASVAVDSLAIVASVDEVVLAVDIGATKFAAGLVTLRGDLLDRSKVLIERDAGASTLFELLTSVVTQQLEQARTHHRVRVRAVGIGSAGPVTHGCETVSPVNIAGWRGFPLRGRLADLTGLPVHGDLDAKALALAEGWLGAARGATSFCAITVSTGVGGGIVVDGKLLDGESGNAGHVGHIIVEPGGRRCGCGARGCLEAEASGSAIEAITGRSPSEPTYEIMQRTGRLVGRAVATLSSALDLDLVVVGGSVALGFAATFFNAAQDEADAHSRATGRSPRITPVKLGDRGPLIGAGAVAIRGLRRGG
jgi:glucokinase